MQEICILALDPGTANLGYAVLQGIPDASKPRNVPKITKVGVLRTKKTDGTIRDRLDRLGCMVHDLINDIQPDYMVLEDFVEQGKYVGKTYKEMAFLVEHLRLVGKMRDIPTTIYKNAEWKKRTLDARGASKDQVQHYVAFKFQDSAYLLKKQPSHVWDSVAIGYAKWLSILK